MFGLRLPSGKKLQTASLPLISLAALSYATAASSSVLHMFKLGDDLKRKKKKTNFYFILESSDATSATFVINLRYPARTIAAK